MILFVLFVPFVDSIFFPTDQILDGMFFLGNHLQRFPFQNLTKNDAHSIKPLSNYKKWQNKNQGNNLSKNWTELNHPVFGNRQAKSSKRQSAGVSAG